MYNQTEFINKLTDKYVFTPAQEQKHYDRIVAINDRIVATILWSYDDVSSPTDYDCYTDSDLLESYGEYWQYMGVIANIYIDGVLCATSSLWGIESFAVFYNGSYSAGKWSDVETSRLGYENEQIEESLSQLQAYKSQKINDFTTELTKYDTLAQYVSETDFSALSIPTESE